MTERLKRARTQLQEAEAELIRMQRSGRVVAPASLMARITRLRQEVAEAEAYEPRRLSELIDSKTLDKSKIADKIIKLHIAADYLDDCAMELKEGLKQFDLIGCSLFPMVDEIEKLAGKFAALVCHPEFGGLQDFMVTNARLIDDLHLIINRYMDDKLRMNNK